MDLHRLTPKQKRVLEWIESYLSQHGILPSRREIAEGLGLRSPATIQQHIEVLEAKGFIQRQDEPRGLRPLSLIQSSSLKGEQIPLRGVIAAGFPIEVYEQNRHLELPQSFFVHQKWRDRLFALQVSGESMKDLGILPGDYVVLVRESQPRSGDVVAALLNGEATLKTLRWVRPEVNEAGIRSRVRDLESEEIGVARLLAELHPANPSFPVVSVFPEDRFEIQGVLVGTIRQYAHRFHG